jgi:hypothetical protein
VKSLQVIAVSLLNYMRLGQVFLDSLPFGFIRQQNAKGFFFRIILYLAILSRKVNDKLVDALAHVSLLHLESTEKILLGNKENSLRFIVTSRRRPSQAELIE